MEETPVAQRNVLLGKGVQGPVNREQRDSETPNPFEEAMFGYA